MNYVIHSSLNKMTHQLALVVLSWCLGTTYLTT